MAEYSYATERKIRILKEKVGEDWQEKYGNRSIDAVYNEVMGDTRKNLFCKVDPEIKSKVDELTDNYDIKMSELIELLIEREYDSYKQRTGNYSDDLANEFAKS